MNTQDQAALRGFDKLPNSANVRLAVVAALDSISMPTAWRRVKSGLLPRVLKIGNTATVNVGAFRKLRAEQMGGAK